MCWFKKNKPIPVSNTIVVTPYKDGGKTGNLPSMRVDIKTEDITYDPVNMRLIINNILPQVTIETVQNTNSMEHFIDVGHTLILSNNQKYKDALRIGNVIIFDAGDGYKVIHAITYIDIDEGERIFQTQGWNLKEPDPYSIHLSQVISVLLIPIPTKEFQGWKADIND